MTRTTAINWLKVITYIGVYGGLLLPLVFIPVVIFPFVFSKHIAFQVLIGLTFPAYVALAWAEPKYRPRWNAPLFLAIICYFVALGLSVAFAVDPLRAWWGNQERMNGLFQVLHFFVWLVMLTSMLHTWKQWRTILLFEIVLGAFMGIVSLLQIPFPRLLMFQAGPRVGGLLDNPIYMAAYQIFNLFFIALLWLKGANKGTKAFMVIAALIDIGAFLAAQSRGALVGLFAGLIAFAFFYVLMSKSRKAKITVLSLLALVFVGYGVIYANRESTFVKETPLSRLTDLNATIDTRVIAWKIALEGFVERPLTGWGLDDYHILFNAKYNPESLEHGYYETWFDRSHNTMLDVLSMTGIFGMVAYLGIWGALFYSVIRAYKRKWLDNTVASILLSLPIAYFVQNLFVFDQPAGFTMSYFMYALIIAACSPEFMGQAAHEDKADAKIDAVHRDVPWTLFAIVSIFSLFVVWRASILPWQASAYSILSNNYFSAGAYQEAYNYAKLAAAVPTPYLDEQTFLQSRNLMTLVDNNALPNVPYWKQWHDLIVDVTMRHLQDHPNNTHPLFILATFYQRFSKAVPEDAPLTEQYFKRAIETSPRRQQLFYSLARFYIEQGKKQEGYDTFKRALDLDGNVGESHWYVGLSLTYDLNQPQEGAKELALAMSAKSPYALKDIREIVALGQAYATLGDKEGFTANVFNNIRNFPNGQPVMYVEIARSAEKLGLLDQRDRLLKALTKIDPSLEMRLGPLFAGLAKTLDQSLNMTMQAAMAQDQAKAAAASSSHTTPPTGQQLASSTAAPSGPGPRMR